MTVVDAHAHIMLEPYASLSPIEPQQVMDGFARRGPSSLKFLAEKAKIRC